MSRAAKVGALKPAAKVKGRTLPCPEEMPLSPYTFKHGQGLPHSHYPGMRDFTRAYILVQGSLLVVLLSSCYWAVFPPTT